MSSLHFSLPCVAGLFLLFDGLRYFVVFTGRSTSTETCAKQCLSCRRLAIVTRPSPSDSTCCLESRRVGRSRGDNVSDAHTDPTAVGIWDTWRVSVTVAQHNSATRRSPLLSLARSLFSYGPRILLQFSPAPGRRRCGECRRRREQFARDAFQPLVSGRNW